MGSSQVFDAVFQFGKVTKSSIEKSAKTVIHQVAGIASLFETDSPEDDDAGQVADNTEAFGSPGMVFHPLTPGKSPDRKVEVHAEVLCVKTADGLVAVGYRDERLNQAYPNPKEGDVAVVHYGGGFHSMSLTPDESSSIHVIYAPYDFNSNGVAQKAHAITIDTTAGSESIQLVHSSGSAVSILEDSVVARAGDGKAYFALKSSLTGGSFDVVAQKIALKGSVFLGPQGEAGLPLTPGPASPPGPSIYISPV